MKRRTVLKSAALGAAAVPTGLLAGTASAGRGPYFDVTVTEQNTNRLLTFHKSDDWHEANIVWSWSPGIGGWYNLSDVRFRDIPGYGKVALAAASGGNAGIIKITGERHQGLDDLLWTGAPGGNPHAIERVPFNGAVVTASSAGYLNVYGPGRIHRPDTLELVQRVDLPGAHGVLWDPTLRVLWGIGDKVLKMYKVHGHHRQVNLLDLGNDVPLAGLGHDLQPDYTDRRTLLITDTYGAYSVDTSTLAVTTLREGRLIKSYVRHRDGDAFWLQALNLPPRAWSSPTVSFESGDKTLADAQIYKARWVTTAYE